jgi:hypothetical protein
MSTSRNGGLFDVLVWEYPHSLRVDLEFATIGIGRVQPFNQYSASFPRNRLLTLFISQRSSPMKVYRRYIDFFTCSAKHLGLIDPQESSLTCIYFCGGIKSTRKIPSCVGTQRAKSTERRNVSELITRLCWLCRAQAISEPSNLMAKSPRV